MREHTDAPHPSLIDLNARRAQHIAERRAAEPIQLHCRRPKWEPVIARDPDAALHSTIAQATHKPTDIDISLPRAGSMTDATTADMSRGIGKALEDAEQQGYVRGHKHGLEQAVFVEKIDYIAIGTISGFICGWVLFVGLPKLMHWVG